MFGNKKPKIPISKNDIKKAIKNANEKLQAQNKKIESNIKDAKLLLSDIESKSKSAEDALKSLKAQASSVKSSIKSNAVKLDQSSRDLADAFKELTEIKNSKNFMEESVSGLLKQEIKSKKAISDMEKQLEKKVGLKSSITALNKELKEVKQQVKIRQSEIDLVMSDAVAAQASKDSLEAEFKDYKASVDEERMSLQKDIELATGLKNEKQRNHDDIISRLDNEIKAKQEEAKMYTDLAKKAEQDYIAIQSNIILAEKKVNKLEEDKKTILEKQESGIARVKERYESWKINELDKVAKLKIKGKIDGSTGLLPVLKGIYHIRIEYPDSNPI